MNKPLIAALAAACTLGLIGTLLRAPEFDSLLPAAEAAASKVASAPETATSIPRHRLPVNDSEHVYRESSAEPSPAKAGGFAASGDETLFVVVNESAAGVPNASVQVWGVGDGQARHEGWTGPDGSILLSVAAGDRLEIAADDFAPGNLCVTDPPWDRPFRIVLRRGATIVQATVVDDLDIPVRDALIRVQVAGTVLRGRSGLDGSVALRSEIQLDGVHPVLIEVEHPEVCWPLESVPVPMDFGSGSPRTLRTFRWAQVRLEAYGPNMERLEGILAWLTHHSDQSTPASELQHAGDATHIQLGERNGQPSIVVLRAPPLLDLSLWIEHPSFLRRRVRLDPLAPGEVHAVVHRFRETEVRSTARVLLIDERDNALSGTLTVHTASGSRVHRVLAGGAATFPLPETDWRLVAASPGYASAERRFEAEAPPEGVLEVQLASSGPGFEILVTDERESAVEGVFLQAIMESPIQPGDFMPAATATTDERGTVRFDGLLPGKYRVVVGFGSPGNYSVGDRFDEVPHPAEVRGLGPGDRARIRLVSPSSIGGRVLDLEGRSLNWSWVDPDARTVAPVFTSSTVPGPDGEFLVTGLPPGRYAGWVAGGSFRSPLLEIDLGLAEELRGVEVRAPRE